MKVTPAPTRFELGEVRTPAGGRQIVVRMVVGTEELVGTPSNDELRFLRSAIAELLNNAGRPMPAFPATESEPGRARRRRLWTPSAS